MKRLIDKHLLNWKSSKSRKPLVLRGARQVGKTFACRKFGETFDNMVEINFEKLKDAGKIFSGNLDINTILRDLNLYTREKIIPGKTLLFLDEIQVEPRVVTALRYFYEECPQLHVIAAGSLIDFCLEGVGMPVGRVEFAYLYPLSFYEFLLATGNNLLIEHIKEHDSSAPISNVAHDKAMTKLIEYFAVGGMPEVVANWLEFQDIELVTNTQNNIINSYKLDFPKYAKSHQLKYVTALFEQTPKSMCKKFKYSNINGEYRARDLAPCLDLLATAKVINKVRHTSANGVPLGAEAHHKIFKVIMLDIALAQSLMGQEFSSWFLNPEETLVNRGEIAEAFVGQELLAYANPRHSQELYYWQREVKSSQAEIDYVINDNSSVVPIEVKSGKSKKMKSMEVFMQEKSVTRGICFSSDNFGQIGKIERIPLYAIFKKFLKE